MSTEKIMALVREYAMHLHMESVAQANFVEKRSSDGWHFRNDRPSYATMAKYASDQGVVCHLKLSGPKSKHPKPCEAPIELEGKTVRCLAFSSFECDYPVAIGVTCDAPLCADHATQVGPDRHYCPKHAAQSDRDLFS